MQSVGSGSALVRSPLKQRHGGEHAAKAVPFGPDGSTVGAGVAPHSTGEGRGPATNDGHARRARRDPLPAPDGLPMAAAAGGFPTLADAVELGLSCLMRAPTFKPRSEKMAVRAQSGPDGRKHDPRWAPAQRLPLLPGARCQRTNPGSRLCCEENVGYSRFSKGAADEASVRARPTISNNRYCCLPIREKSVDWK